MKKEEIKKISKENAMRLYNVLCASKSSALEKEDKIQLILLRSKLKAVAEEQDVIIEDTRKNVAEKDFKDVASAALQKWGKEEVEIDTRVLSEDKLLSLLSSNDFVGVDEDVLWENLKK